MAFAGCFLLNPFTTGNPFLGSKLLGFSIGRGSGTPKGLKMPGGSCACSYWLLATCWLPVPVVEPVVLHQLCQWAYCVPQRQQQIAVCVVCRIAAIDGSSVRKHVVQTNPPAAPMAAPSVRTPTSHPRPASHFHVLWLHIYHSYISFMF